MPGQRAGGQGGLRACGWLMVLTGRERITGILCNDDYAGREGNRYITLL